MVGGLADLLCRRATRADADDKTFAWWLQHPVFLCVWWIEVRNQGLFMDNRAGMWDVFF